MNTTIRWLIIIIIIVIIIYACSWYINHKNKQFSSFNPVTKFNCSKCGKCCYQLKNVIENKHKISSRIIRQMIDAFPYSFDKYGKCEKLTNNQCSVYNTRPDLCNVVTTWKRAFADKMSLDDYFQINKQMCKQLNN